MDLVNKILEDDEIAKASTVVKKHLELKFDLGTLLAVDENELDFKAADADKYLAALARDNAQLLINEIWKLPTEKHEEVLVALLPKQTTVLPRALPTPKPRVPTKWEQFAKDKGIVKKKKDKLKWNDILKKWVPLHGYKKAEAEKEKDWVIEVPVTADPYEDQFEKKKNEKSERVAKNEFQRLRNMAKAQKIKVPKVGLAPQAKPTSTHLGAALTLAKASTASLGKFQKGLPKEKVAKNVKDMLPGTRKRKAPPLRADQEKTKSLTLIDNILNKKPKINVEQAVEKEVHAKNDEENKKKFKGKKGKKAGGRTKTGAKGGKFRGPAQSPGRAAGEKGRAAGAAGKGGGKGAGKKTRVGGKTKGGRKRR